MAGDNKTDAGGVGTPELTSSASLMAAGLAWESRQVGGSVAPAVPARNSAR